MKDILCTLITVCYNSEATIRQTFESVLHQTYKNIEIILVDDGSPDNSSHICDQYAKLDKRFKVIHKNNGGLSSARNAGMRIATGDYITFCDSDDFLLPQTIFRYIELQNRKIKK